MTRFPPRIAHARTALSIAAAVLLAACQKPSPGVPGGEVAAAPAAPAGAPTSSLTPAAQPAATPGAGDAAMPGMDHAAMPGMDHSAMPGMQEGAGQVDAPRASADVTGRFGTGRPVTVLLHVRAADGAPLGPDALQTVHDERLHVLAVDPSLTDYSHSHPVPTTTPGDWTFQFTPRHDRPYHLWLDLTPTGGKQAYVLVAVNATAQGAPVDRTLATTASAGGLEATLTFDAPLVAGQAAMGHVRIARGGKPVAVLEPVMGAYAHIVGIAEDFETIAHVHPLGAEPTSPGQRGGPVLDFHVEPAKPGFLKLFAQVRVDGRDVFLPFGVTVAAAGAQAAPAHMHH